MLHITWHPNNTTHQGNAEKNTNVCAQHHHHNSQTSPWNATGRPSYTARGISLHQQTHEKDSENAIHEIIRGDRKNKAHGWERHTIQHTSEILLGTVPPMDNHWIDVSGNGD